MKFKKDVILLGIMAIVIVCASGITVFCNDQRSYEKGTIKIMASFYPVYVIAMNLADGIEGVEAACMTQNQTGCLHDYQMTTQDMKMLEHSDIFLINGGGMEAFLEDVVKNYPSLPVINTGEELEDAMKEGHSHDHEGNEEYGADTDHVEYEDHVEGNAHFWLNPEYYIVQIQAAADGLSRMDKAHAQQYQENARKYIKKVRDIAEQMKTELKVPHMGVVVFHDAFVYLAEYLGLEVIHTVEMDSETALSAGEVAEIMEEIRKNQVSVLFTEAQYSTEAAETIGKETGAVCYVIDSIVTGDGSKDSYLNGMWSNLKILKEAFTS